MKTNGVMVLGALATTSALFLLEKTGVVNPGMTASAVGFTKAIGGSAILAMGASGYMGLRLESFREKFGMLKKPTSNENE